MSLLSSLLTESSESATIHLSTSAGSLASSGPLAQASPVADASARDGQPVIGDGCGITHHRVAFRGIRKQLNIINGPVDNGNTVMVIKHDIKVIETSDWIVDMGPEGGVEGGTIVAEGTPEDIASVPESYTGKFLAEVVGRTGTSASAGHSGPIRVAKSAFKFRCPQSFSGRIDSRICAKRLAAAR